MKIILDIETNLAHDTIWCVVTKDIDTNEVKVWKEKSNDFTAYLSACEQIIMHNGIAFDAPVLNRVWDTNIKYEQCYDTLLVSRMTNPSREGGHSLAAWGETMKFPKGDFTDFDGGFTEEMLTYCIQDVNLTHLVYKAVCSELTKYKITEQAVKIEHDVQVVVAEMERNGFKLDIPYAQAMLSEIKTEMSFIEENLQTIFPAIVEERYSEKTGKRLKDSIEVFNVGSRQQIAKRLIEKGWKPTKKTEKGQIIVDESVLEEIDIPEAKPIARYLTLQKRAAQLDSWLEHLGNDGRVHGRVITFGAVTGRATHSSPNMAQVPAVRAVLGKEFRSCWIVEKGNVLVGTDLSGIELRCFAHYLNDQEYINEVVYGDVHTRNQKAFGAETRDQAKTILYAMLYGASPTKIGSIMGAGEKEGERTLANFKKAVPAYSVLKENVEKIGKKGSLKLNAGGYRLQVRSSHSSLNTLLQGAGAIISKVWMIQVKKNLEAAGIPFKIVAWIHDEIQLETPKQYGDEVGKMVVQSANETQSILEFRCPIDAEYKIGNNWADCH